MPSRCLLHHRLLSHQEHALLRAGLFPPGRIENWTQTTDRELKISGRHSKRYYQYADHLLKSEVARLKTGIGGDQIESARRGLRETFHEVEA
jgi:hypothetical protein